MVARKLTEKQADYLYLQAIKGLSVAEISKRYSVNRSTVHRTVQRALKNIQSVQQNPQFQRIKLGQPPKETIARTERHCPHCSARPGPKLSMNTNDVRTDFDMFRDKSGALCHNCGWSF